MADQVTDTIRWPDIPQGISPDLREYLEGMQAAINEYLSGTLSVSGDLSLGGFLLLQAPNRIKTLIT